MDKAPQTNLANAKMVKQHLRQEQLLLTRTIWVSCLSYFLQVHSCLPGPQTDPTPRLVPLQVIMLSATGLFSGFETNCTATAAPLPFNNFVYMDYFSVIYKNCTATAPALTKIRNWTAKSTPYLRRTGTISRLKHIDGGRMLPQVTQPSHIAGPLALISY